MKMIETIKKLNIIILSLIISSCGDFPDYYFDQSDEHCSMSFPFAGGIIGRQYIGYFRMISSLQYLDDDPSYKIIITGPSHIILEVGSVQKVIIADKIFIPKFAASHLEAEFQLLGTAFIFDAEQSNEMYQLISEGYNINIVGRIEVGHQYDTDIYNFFFNSKNEPLKNCVNRLLDDEDLLLLKK